MASYDGKDLPTVETKLKDRLKEDLEVLKKAPFREKIQFLWDYYKLPFFVIVVVAVILVSAVTTAVTAKEPYLSGIMLNSYHSGPETDRVRFAEDFLAAEQADEKYVYEINTSLLYHSDNTASPEENYYALSRVAAQITAHELDFITADMKTMLEFAYGGMIEDLSEVLTEAQLVCYEPYLCYIDLALLEDGAAVTEFPDCRKPEEMKEPVPVLIDVTGSEYLAEGYQYSDQIAFGVAVNAPREKNVAALIDFLMDDVK